MALRSFLGIFWVNAMDAIECIQTRKSIRFYQATPLEEDLVIKILKTAIQAPSARNRQPWKFKIVFDKKTIEKFSDLSVQSKWIKTAPCMVIVFLDQSNSDDYVKDVQSCGAIMQNILLAAHAYGIASCWIGEFTSKQEDIFRLCAIPKDKLDFMGAITLGYPRLITGASGRKELETFLL